MKVTDLLIRAEKFAVDNSPLILTVVGVTGVVTTAVLTGKATYKATEILIFEDRERERNDLPSRSYKENALRVWPLFIPPLATAALTITSVVCANRIGTRRAAAMAAAFTLSERAFEEYREKIVDRFGANESRKIHDDIAQDRVNAHPVGKTEVIITGGGNVLFYDSYTGRYFQSDMESVKQAQNNLNHQILNHMYASLNDFYDRVGLSRTKNGDEVGWNSDELLECTFSTTISDDGRPAIVVDFHVSPVRDYFRAHSR